MSNSPHCYLTMKDFGVLEQLMESGISDFAYLRLLRHKITTATILFEDDAPPDVASLGSRVEFQIDGLLVDSCILSANSSAAQSRLKLPITTMRGLALLGLREGAFTAIEQIDGSGEQLRLLKVHPRPGRSAPVSQLPVDGPMRRMPVSTTRKLQADIDPDDDPGPQAA